MRILFSPSESKNLNCSLSPFDEGSFILRELFKFRLEAPKNHESHTKNATQEDLREPSGMRNLPQKFLQGLKNAPAKYAIELYTGVSYEFSDYQNLKQKAKNRTLENTLVFSNLFGMIRTRDTLPFYKSKQDAKLKDSNVEYFYKKHFGRVLDKSSSKEEVFDLKAESYDRFYTPKKKVSAYEFPKNGKIVSHYARAYRGILLRIAAQNQILSNKEFLAKLPSNLRLKNIKEFKLKEEVTLETVD